MSNKMLFLCRTFCSISFPCTKCPVRIYSFTGHLKFPCPARPADIAYSGSTSVYRSSPWHQSFFGDRWIPDTLIKAITELLNRGKNHVRIRKYRSTFPTSQAYTCKRRILIEVLPAPNAYTKSANACIHYAKSICYLLMHICIWCENCN